MWQKSRQNNNTENSLKTVLIKVSYYLKLYIQIMAPF